MIQSMTGYGKSVVTFNEKKIHVEIKSLNSKALDLSTRIAPLYREKEMEIRQLVAKTLIRGKVDFSIWIESRSRRRPDKRRTLRELLRPDKKHLGKSRHT